MGVIGRATMGEQVRDHLREEILSNRIAPGARLQEEVIAASLGISPAPVREALRLLAAEDLVTITPRRGALVKTLSREEFLAAYQVREALEVLAISLAVPRLEPQDIARLSELHEQMKAARRPKNIDRFFRANAEFHQILVDRSGNACLQAVYSQLMNNVRRYRMKSLYLRGGLDRSLAEHAEILEAIRRRDVSDAARLLREHIQVPQRLLHSSSEEELVHGVTL